MVNKIFDINIFNHNLFHPIFFLAKKHSTVFNKRKTISLNFHPVLSLTHQNQIGMTKKFVHVDKICHGNRAYNSMDICG